MKRRLLLVAVFLLAGAVVNVAVAWGCARWSDCLEIMTFVLRHASKPTPDAGSSGVTTSASAAWRLHNVPESWPDKPADEVTTRTGWFLVTNQVRPLDNGGVVILNEYRFGVPTKSLACYKLVVVERSGTWTDSWRYAIARFGGSYPLPLRPIWPGFAANTLFYAAVLWLLICGPFALRRLVRVKRGLCPACAYPRGESDVCSECSKALPSRHIIV